MSQAQDAFEAWWATYRVNTEKISNPSDRELEIRRMVAKLAWEASWREAFAYLASVADAAKRLAKEESL